MRVGTLGGYLLPYPQYWLRFFYRGFSFMFKGGSSNVYHFQGGAIIRASGGWGPSVVWSYAFSVSCHGAIVTQ